MDDRHIIKRSANRCRRTGMQAYETDICLHAAHNATRCLAIPECDRRVLEGNPYDTTIPVNCTDCIWLEQNNDAAERIRRENTTAMLLAIEITKKEAIGEENKEAMDYGDST